MGHDSLVVLNLYAQADFTHKVSKVGQFPVIHSLYVYCFFSQVARFKRQKAAETKLQEIRERKERRGRSLRAAALAAPIETGEEDDLEDDGEEEREVSIPHLEAVFMICLGFFIFQIRMICGMCVP